MGGAPKKAKEFLQNANILAGADASTGANANRAADAASRRLGSVADSSFDSLAGVLLDPEVLKHLPDDIRAAVDAGDPKGFLAATQYILRSGGTPKNIPGDRALARNPGGEAGFVMGENGGRVRQQPVGDLSIAGPRGVQAFPGAEAGFTWDGIPSSFDISPRPSVQRSPRRRDSVLPWVGAAGATALGGGVLIRQLLNQPPSQPPSQPPRTPANSPPSPPLPPQGSPPEPSVDVIPESDTSGAPEAQVAPSGQRMIVNGTYEPEQPLLDQQPAYDGGRWRRNVESLSSPYRDRVYENPPPGPSMLDDRASRRFVSDAATRALAKLRAEKELAK